MIECLCSPNYNLKKKDTPNVYFIGNGLSSAALREVMELIGDDDFSVDVYKRQASTSLPPRRAASFRTRSGSYPAKQQGRVQKNAPFGFMYTSLLLSLIHI